MQSFVLKIDFGGFILQETNIKIFIAGKSFLIIHCKDVNNFKTFIDL